MNRTLFAVGTAAAIAMAGPAFSAELITNGSFETGNFSGWSLSNVGGGTAPVVIPYNSNAGWPGGAFGEPIPVDNASPGDAGNFVAYFSSDTAHPDTLSQTVNVIAGQTYNLSFDYYVPQNGYNNPYDATLSFLIDGNPAGATLQAGSVIGTPATTWFNFATTYKALTNGPVTLAFQFNGLGVTAADFAVDKVSMQAVPEPGTWAMMILGLGIVGASFRRRRTTVSFA